MPTTKVRGRDLTGSFAGVDLASASRSFEYSGEADEIDASTRDSLVAGARQFLADAPSYEFTWEGLDVEGTHAAIGTIDVGDEGSLVVNTGQGSFTVTAIITKQEYKSEYDDVAEWTLAGRMNAKPVWS